MIELLEGFPLNVVAIRASGEVTKHDYDAVLTPRIEAAFAGQAKVRVYYEVGGDFSGFEPGAMWADFRMGMAHLTGWDKVAVVTDVAWLRQATEFFRFMMPAEVKVFALADAEVAKDWIRAA
ncbi:SpoIIAA family protein [Xanthobacter variabilis]|uniref:STAS/SEC14 domain-containing protein n=1 Tax=Xanthobacter variabilis TaxID=3119932 RepID=UPI00374F65B2